MGMKKEINGRTSSMMMMAMMLAIMLVMMLIMPLKMMLNICKHDLGFNMKHGLGHDVKDVIHNTLK
jgi:hypothetical protein